ncbi:MAG: superoxide dismutase [Fe] [Legionellales bacterium]|nr:superoxide dismutase [Fe] [Legionellales bacterium]|tara:strand:- start:140 stop:730 length:591 start_codon:yes stop_codon:yes gene_type:complete
MHELPKLPYAKDALAPYISEETLDYHYSKHHQKYVDEVNRLLEGSTLENNTLEQVVLNSDGALFNNAAQAWNHNIYWECMSPNKTPMPQTMDHAISESFGSYEAFLHQFKQASLKHFGSGWVWLVVDSTGRLSITSTVNAGTPLTDHMSVALACDVWEHAYYLDTRNDRGSYIDNFFQVVNWDYVSHLAFSTSSPG